MAWEYRFLIGDLNEIEADLNDMDRQGWEPILMTTNSSGWATPEPTVLLLRRQRRAPNSPPGPSPAAPPSGPRPGRWLP